MNARIDPSLDPAPVASMVTAEPLAKPAPLPRSAYRRFVALGTRWLDNDAYGHVNNAVYYGFFDTAVNGVMVEAGALDIARGGVIGLVVESHCNYFASLAFPEPIEAGIRVARVGETSLRWEVGIFAAGAPESAARGHFVHVYVDRESRRPVPLPARLRALAEELR